MIEPLHPDRPVAGLYRRKLVRGGPWVPVHIDKHCKCTIGGGDDNILHVWTEDCDRNPPLTALISGVMIEAADQHFTYCYGHQIDQEEYDQLLGLCDWAEEHAEEDPYANTTKKIDPSKIKSLF